LKGKYECNRCDMRFKREYELESHLDTHTPFWKGKKITLSGGDQIRLMLKGWAGSWNKVIKDEQKRVKQKGDYDLNKLIKLRDFEKENNIEFVLCGDRVEQYRSTICE
jgi:hypothetical protein